MLIIGVFLSNISLAVYTFLITKILMQKYLVAISNTYFWFFTYQNYNMKTFVIATNMSVAVSSQLYIIIFTFFCKNCNIKIINISVLTIDISITNI